MQVLLPCKVTFEEAGRLTCFSCVPGLMSPSLSLAIVASAFFSSAFFLSTCFVSSSTRFVFPSNSFSIRVVDSTRELALLPLTFSADLTTRDFCRLSEESSRSVLADADGPTCAPYMTP